MRMRCNGGGERGQFEQWCAICCARQFARRIATLSEHHSIKISTGALGSQPRLFRSPRRRHFTMLLRACQLAAVLGTATCWVSPAVRPTWTKSGTSALAACAPATTLRRSRRPRGVAHGPCPCLRTAPKERGLPLRCGARAVLPVLRPPNLGLEEGRPEAIRGAEPARSERLTPAPCLSCSPRGRRGQVADSGVPRPPWGGAPHHEQ